jgi:hypothetical protein
MNGGIVLLTHNREGVGRTAPCRVMTPGLGAADLALPTLLYQGDWAFALQATITMGE